jgi:NADH-quinone oxidoreductase subunit L
MAWKLYTTQGLQGDELLKSKLGGFYKVLENKFYVDEFYNAVIVRPFVFLSERFIMFLDNEIVDGAVNGSADLTNISGGIIKKLQTGFVQHYAIIMVSGIIAIIAYMMF